jgi:hypothetical protein
MTDAVKPTSFRLRESTLKKLLEIQKCLDLKNRIDALEQAIDTAHKFHTGKPNGTNTSGGGGVTIRITGATGMKVTQEKKKPKRG